MKKTPEQKIKEYFNMDYTQSFSERGRTVPAEDKLEKYYNSKANTKFLRYGPDHMVAPVQTKFYVKIDPFIRNTPDYIIMNKGAYFLEAKGCHYIAKFKIDDLKSYAKWNDIMPLSFFVFSTMYQKIIQFDIGQLRYLIIKKQYKTERYPDNNKEYYPIPFKDLIPLNKLK